MYFAYVLKSSKNGRYYYGYTNNLSRRLIEHNSGHSKSTRYISPLKLVYHEKFTFLRQARIRERFFKSGKGREYIKLKLIERSP